MTEKVRPTADFDCMAEIQIFNKVKEFANDKFVFLLKFNQGINSFVTAVYYPYSCCFMLLDISVGDLSLYQRPCMSPIAKILW